MWLWLRDVRCVAYCEHNIGNMGVAQDVGMA